jgi:hypothetical protein
MGVAQPSEEPYLDMAGRRVFISQLEQFSFTDIRILSVGVQLQRTFELGRCKRRTLRIVAN